MRDRSEVHSPLTLPPSRRRAALVNVMGMGGNTSIVVLQAIVLVPVYLNTLGARLYGAWLGSGEILNFLSLFDLGLTNVVTQRIGAAHARGEHERVGELFGSAVLAMGAIGAALGIVVLGLSPWIGGLMHLEGAEAQTLKSCFRVGALTTFLFVANFSVLGLCRGIQDTALQNIGTVTGAIAGFATSAVLIFSGAGLWAIVLGSCVRTAVILIVSIIYVVRLSRRGGLVNVRLSRTALVDFWRVSPATTISGIGYLLTTQTESTLVATLLGPERVPILMLTRRAIDVAGGLLNTISYSSYAGFAHLVASPERERAMAVYYEVRALWLSLALAAAVAYIAINHSLVSVWVGSEHYGGMLLTVLLAAQMIVIGRTQVLYYLYRAAGAIVPGSLLQFGESLIRFALTVVLIKTVGLTGPSIAALLVALPVSQVAARRTLVMIRSFAAPVQQRIGALIAVRVVLTTVGLGIGAYFFAPHWAVALPVGAALAVVAVIAQVAVAPELRLIRTTAAQFAERLGKFGRPASVV